MTKDGVESRRWFRRRTLPLQVKVASLLGLALLPLGLISVIQTANLVDEKQALSRAALLGQTERTAAIEQAEIHKALGAASGLAQVALGLGDDPARCAETMRDYVARSRAHAFAGFIDADGIVACASDGMGSDVSELPLFADQAERPRDLVNLYAEGMVTGLPAIIVTRPVLDDDGNFDGVVTISFSIRQLNADLVGAEAWERGFSLALFDRFGQVIASGADAEDGAHLPAAFNAEHFLGTPPRTFQSMTADGELRSFAVVPVIDQSLYAISSWRSDSAWRSGPIEMIVPVSFPLLICLVSLLVAYFSVNRLVIAHVSLLRRRINRFALGERDIDMSGFENAPQELRELAERFERLARTIAADEAAQEEALREKSLLLKEVYHRVKNNLQLIVSIMNMQIRNARTEREEALLRQLQERVMSLSIIHRNLYEAPSLTELRADQLLEEIVSQLRRSAPDLGPGADLVTDFDAVTLTPDQAVPLSLLVSEAGSNAIWHNDWNREGAFARFSLKRMAGDRIELEIVNSAGTPPEPSAAGVGLGRRLIAAFARQLDGRLDVDETPERYTLRLSFQLQAPESAQAAE